MVPPNWHDADLLAMLKRQALAGQVVDYPKVYTQLKVLDRLLLFYPMAKVLMLIRFYLDKLTLAGGIDSTAYMYPKIAAIVELI